MIIAIALLLAQGAVLAQTTSFTYQGKLTDGGTPANGNYDLQFGLWDSAPGGTQIGTTQTVNSVAVSGGIFTVTLDFGVNAFPGANRFLEIGARLGGGGSFTILAPRQQISSTPYAIRTLNAGAADALSSACVACVQDSQINQVAGSKVNGTIPVASVPAGSANYIQNTTSPQTSANFNVDGNGSAAGTLSGNVVNSATQYNLGGNRVLSTPGTNNLFAGIGAGQVNTGSHNVFAGTNAGQFNSTGSANTFIGSFAGTSSGLSQTSNSTAIGFAAKAESGSSTAIGANAVASGPNATMIGAYANAGGPGATAIGVGAIASGANSTVIGVTAGASGGHSTAIGASASASGANSTAIGAEASAATDHTIVLGTAAESVFVPGTLSKLNIAAQDGLQISGYQPYLTLQDTSASNKNAFLQSANGDAFLLTNNRNSLVLKDLTGC